MQELIINRENTAIKKFIFFMVLCISILPMFNRNEELSYTGINQGIECVKNFILPDYAFAANTKGSGAGGVDVTMDNSGNIVLEGSGVDFNDSSSNSWNTLFGRYKNIIAGLSGIATLTMLGAFIYMLTKLGATSGNDKARKECLNGILFTGIATAGLGSVTIIMAFFYNAFAGL